MRIALCIMVLFLLLGAFHAAAEEEAAEPTERELAITEYIEQNTPDWIDREALNEALNDAGDNWEELAKALLEYLPPGDAGTDGNHAYANLLWLIESAPHLDRLELTTVILVTNMDLALKAAEEMGYSVDSDFFRRYVLNYRLDYEPVTYWRPVIAERYCGQGRETMSIEELAAAATDGFNVFDRGYYGNLADPVSLDNARAGAAREFSILTAAVLRAAGYGVRFVRENRSGKSWVEVYTGPGYEYDATAWIPVYPSSPEHTRDTGYAAELCDGWISVVTAGDAFGREQVTSRYNPVGGVQVHFTRDGEEQPEFEHWSISAWSEGSIIPLDDLGYPVTDDSYPLTMGAEEEEAEIETYYVGAPGEYQLQAGVRYPGGYMHLQTQDFTVEPDELVLLNVALDTPKDIPLEALVERSIADPLPETDSFLADGSFVYVIHDEDEPSVVALQQLEHYGDSDEVEYAAYTRWPDDAELAEWLKGTLKVRDNDPLPVVIVVVDGETRLYLRGLNKAIGEWVTRALAAGSA